MSGVLNTAITLVRGWSVTMDSDEPRIRDEELGARLGFARPRDIRKLIERLVKDEKVKDIRMRATVSRMQLSRGGYRDQVVDEYWLTERQALKVIAKSETAIADAILDEVIDVFIAVRRGQLAAAAAPAPVPILPTSPTLGDLYHDDTKARCAMTARCTGQSVHRVQGWLRVLYNVSSVYRINAAFRDVVFRQLEGWALGRVGLPSKAPRQLRSVPDTAQRVLPFPDAPR